MCLHLFDYFFRKDKSMYHALGYGTNLFLQAMLTFDEVSCFANT